MKLREFPGVSKMFLDMLEGGRGLPSCVRRHSGTDSVRASAEELSARPFPREQFSRFLESQISPLAQGNSAIRNIQRLTKPDSVLIWTSCRANFAGGLLCQFLGCLTAVKLALELDRAGFSAVPVCRIDPVIAAGSGSVLLRMLDLEGEVRPIESEVRASGTTLAIEPVLRQVESLADSVQAAETIELLRKSYTPGTDLTEGAGRVLAALFADWGLVFFDARDREWGEFVQRTSRLDQIGFTELSTTLRQQAAHLNQLGYGGEDSDEEPYALDPVKSSVPALMESILPVAARVVDQSSIWNLALLQPVISQLGLHRASLWPRASATIVDTRSRKVLEKYGIQLCDLMLGSEGVLRKLALRDAPEDTVRRWHGLAESIESCTSKLKVLLPEGENLRALVEDSKGRMLYQVGKLRGRYVAAHQTRREAMQRQIEHTCHTLAPEGCLQELTLAGLHFILRYSPLVLRTIFERLENQPGEHQLIFLE